MSYSRRWDCLICNEPQESIDYPKTLLCDKCIRPLAAMLCKRELGHEIDTEGVNADHWTRKAELFAGVLFKRWKAAA